MAAKFDAMAEAMSKAGKRKHSMTRKFLIQKPPKDNVNLNYEHRHNNQKETIKNKNKQE